MGSRRDSQIGRDGADSTRDLLNATAPASRLAAAAAAGAAVGAAAAASLSRANGDDAADGSLVGLGIQLQEPPEDGTGHVSGFVVTKLISGAPGDKCGLILEVS